jgi:hypothetical protein
MPRASEKEFVKPHVIVVEGLDEFGFILGLLNSMAIETVQIMCLDGVDQLAPRLKAYRMTEGFRNIKRFGVLVDSDGDPEARNRSTRDLLRSSGFSAADMPLVVSGTAPAVMYSTIPSPSSNGCLEDLILDSMSMQHRAPCVEAYLNCAAVPQAQLGSRWAKSWVHSFLSTSETPGLKIGEATKAGLVDVGAPAFEPVRAFLQQLVAM